MSTQNLCRITTAAGVLLFAACAGPHEPPSSAVAPPAATRPAGTVALGSAIGAAPAHRDDYRAGWASRLIGQPAIDPRGSHLGLLTDFVIDARSGAVRYAIVSNKRMPGGERLVAVPLRLLHMTKDNGVLLDIARERFDRQPWWSADRWPVLSDRAAWRDIDRLWGLQPVDAGGLDHPYRVSRLMGLYVDDAEGRHVGRIIDVVIDMDRRAVHYTVLRLQGHAGIPPDHAFAVPVRSLALAGSGRARLAVSQTRLMRLVGTDPDESPSEALRYLGVIDRDFGMAFRRDAGGPHSTAVGATR